MALIQDNAYFMQGTAAADLTGGEVVVLIQATFADAFCI